MHIHLDPIGGIAGDMFAAAMLDLKPDLEPELTEVLKIAESIGGGHGHAVPHHDGVLTGRRFVVEQPPNPCGDHRAHHGHPHVHWKGLRRRIGESALPGEVISRTVGIFEHLAHAEAKIHGRSVEDVAFHEVGAWDSITDIVAAAYFLSAFPTATWSICSLPIGSGRVSGSHGQLPVPAPATAELLEGFVLHEDGLEGERVTPTGAAILRFMRPEYRPSGTWGRLKGNGQGFGTRKLANGVPNMLRVMAFEPVAASSVQDASNVAVLAFDIDDQTGEDLAIACDNIRSLEGVLDVLQSPGFGKKGRMVTQVRVLACPEHAEDIASACLTETSTLGLRMTLESRRTLPRSEFHVKAEDTCIPVKQVVRPDGTRTAKAEADAMAAKKGGYAARKVLRNQAEMVAAGPDNRGRAK